MYVAMNNRYVDLYNIYLININLYLYLTLYTLINYLYIGIFINYIYYQFNRQHISITRIQFPVDYS